MFVRLSDAIHNKFRMYSTTFALGLIIQTLNTHILEGERYTCSQGRGGVGEILQVVQWACRRLSDQIPKQWSCSECQTISR